MNQFGISEKSYQLLLDTFSQYPEIEQVVIFGSRAKGNYKKGSDIDLAIKGKDCKVETALNISAIVNEELPIPYHIDVINYDTLKHLELKDQIDRVGVVFFSKNTFVGV
jgi:predicted nucleotidyltransferase